MPTKYTRIVPIFGLLTAFTLMVGSASAQVSDQTRPQPGAPGAQAPDQPRPQPSEPARPSPSPSGAAQANAEEQTARGELSSIDPTAKMLSIKPTAGAEQKFQYNDSTKVTGAARGGVAGLATQSGKEVVVHFKNEGANRVATEIEVQADEKK